LALRAVLGAGGGETATAEDAGVAEARLAHPSVANARYGSAPDPTRTEIADAAVAQAAACWAGDSNALPDSPSGIAEYTSPNQNVDFRTNPISRLRRAARHPVAAKRKASVLA
jgi:hypothetical protein